MELKKQAERLTWVRQMHKRYQLSVNILREKNKEECIIFDDEEKQGSNRTKYKVVRLCDSIFSQSGYQ